MTLALSYQYRHKNGVVYFHFEQLSIIPVVSLLLTFNKYTASGVLSFSIHHFYVSKCNQGEWTQVCIRTFEKKQTKNERWKKNHRRKTNYFCWKVCSVLGKIFYCNRKYFIMWTPNLIVLRGDQERIWKLGVCNKPQKQENTVFLAPIIVLK